MRRLLLSALCLLGLAGAARAQQSPLHPDTSGPGWTDLFAPDLSDAIYPEGVWRVDGGVLTASEDEALWSGEAYDDFVLDLEFLNAPGTNSGVIVHASDLADWIPNSVEIQIADDYHDEWAKAPFNWQCGAAFGHQAAYRRAVKPAGEWNRMTLTVAGRTIEVVLNGEVVNRIDLSRFTSATVNPDGSEVPAWLSRPPAEIPLRGHIGFQGKHAGAPIAFRHIRIREVK